jgi:hypothetical protein
MSSRKIDTLERYVHSLNILLRGAVYQRLNMYTVVIYYDDREIETGQAFDDVTDAIVYMRLRISKLADSF